MTSRDLRGIVISPRVECNGYLAGLAWFLVGLLVLIAYVLWRIS